MTLNQPSSNLATPRPLRSCPESRHDFFRLPLHVLVGYFRASGYFRIRPFILRSEKNRILVGINIDQLVQEAWDKALQFGINPAATRDECRRDGHKTDTPVIIR